MQNKPFFSHEVSEYLDLNGFHQLDIKGMHDGMIWRREKIALQFWQNRIEMQEQNSLGDYKLKNTYVGFDGHNMQHLIMLLHCMGVITIESACKLAQQQEGNVKHISTLLTSLPATDTLCQR